MLQGEDHLNCSLHTILQAKPKTASLPWQLPYVCVEPPPGLSLAGTVVRALSGLGSHLPFAGSLRSLKTGSDVVKGGA